MAQLTQPLSVSHIIIAARASRRFLLEVHNMAKEYVEYRDSGYWIAGTRVSLDSVVYAFLDGLSPESIVESFDTLMLEEIYGALAFYSGIVRRSTPTYGSPRPSLTRSIARCAISIRSCTRRWSRLGSASWRSREGLLSGRCRPR